MENQEKDHPNFQKYYWDLFKNNLILAGQVDASYKKSSMLVFVVDPVTAIDEGFWNWVEHRLYAMLGAKPQDISQPCQVHYR